MSLLFITIVMYPKQAKIINKRGLINSQFGKLKVKTVWVTLQWGSPTSAALPQGGWQGRHQSGSQRELQGSKFTLKSTHSKRPVFPVWDRNPNDLSPHPLPQLSHPTTHTHNTLLQGSIASILKTKKACPEVLALVVWLRKANSGGCVKDMLLHTVSEVSFVD